MYYVRFLKVPRLKVEDNRGLSCIVKALVTITSDLGDELFESDTPVFTCLMTGDGSQTMLQRQALQWTAGMRSLPLKHCIPVEKAEQSMRMFVSAEDPSHFDLLPSLFIDNLSLVLPAWSGAFSYQDMVADRVIQRRLRLPMGLFLCIQEATGESIARHIWYHPNHPLDDPSNVAIKGTLGSSSPLTSFKAGRRPVYARSCASDSLALRSLQDPA